MSRYALGTFSRGGPQAFAGMVVGDHVADLADLAFIASPADPPFRSSILSMLAEWNLFRPGLDRLGALARDARVEWIRMDTLRVCPPVNLPRQVFCITSAELQVANDGRSTKHLAYSRPPSSVAGAFDPVTLPRGTTRLLLQPSLGIIVGKGGYRIRRDDAPAHVAGCALVSEMMSEELAEAGRAGLAGGLRANGQPGFVPLGPYMVPPDLLQDPQRLQLTVSVSGLRHPDTTASTICDIYEAIEYVSSCATLWPGDLVCVALNLARDGQVPWSVRCGDSVEVAVEGLGRQKLTIRDSERD